METHKVAMSEEMKEFLNEGLRQYAPAYLALSEFQRQVRSRLQKVLDEFDTQFAELALDVADLKPTFPKIDSSDLSENHSWIGLRRTYAREFIVDYYVEWDFKQPKGEDVWVIISIYATRTRAVRDRLFNLLKSQHSDKETTRLEQVSNGTITLTAYCDSELFCSFDIKFRALVEEWLRLLTGIEGIQHLQPATNAANKSETDED